AGRGVALQLLPGLLRDYGTGGPLVGKSGPPGRHLYPRRGLPLHGDGAPDPARAQDIRAAWLDHLRALLPGDGPQRRLHRAGPSLLVGLLPGLRVAEHPVPAVLLRHAGCEPQALLDRDGMVRVVNPAACQLFGSSERQLLGQPIEALTSAISPTGRLGELIRSGSLRDHEVTLGTGEQVAILSVSSFLMHDERDEL